MQRVLKATPRVSFSGKSTIVGFLLHISIIGCKIHDVLSSASALLEYTHATGF